MRRRAKISLQHAASRLLKAVSELDFLSFLLSYSSQSSPPFPQMDGEEFDRRVEEVVERALERHLPRLVERVAGASRRDPGGTGGKVLMPLSPTMG